MNFHAQNQRFLHNISRSEIKHMEMKKNEFPYRLNRRLHAITLRGAMIHKGPERARNGKGRGTFVRGWG